MSKPHFPSLSELRYVSIFFQITGKQKGSVKLKHLSENAAENFVLPEKKSNKIKTKKKTTKNAHKQRKKKHRKKPKAPMK